MPAPITTDQVWREIDRQLFAVLGMATFRAEARTVGIVYIVRDRRLYIAAERTSWKVRHIQQNPNVSLTVTIPKRVPFVPWVKIPAATITFQGEATLHEVAQLPPEICKALLRGVEVDAPQMSRICIIEVKPKGRFLTYGVGVSLAAMRKPEMARGTAEV